MEPLSSERLARIASEAADGSLVYVKMPVDLPGVAEAGDLVHCRVVIDDDGDLVIEVFGSSAYDPQPMRSWPLPKIEEEP